MNKKTENFIFGEKIGILARLFGCWHYKISRPLTIGKETYCVCNSCGARIHFDPETLQTVGSFYYSPRQPLYPDS